MKRWYLTLLLCLCCLAQAQTQQQCLAQVIYMEAVGESELGQRAVAQVVLNRVQHPKYPKNVCAVVFQHNQFSWTKLHTRKKVPDKFLELAQQCKHQCLHNFSATHFHARGARVRWHLKKTAVIGNHIFYQET